jgi:Xaa-Pro aminopeptidase
MLRDLDALMHDRGVAAVIVPLHESMHPAFRWLSRGAKVTRGYAVKPAGQAPVLITYPMEREEAAATGLTVRLAHEMGHERIFRAASSPVEGYARFYAAILESLAISGKVAFFGNLPANLYMPLGEALRRHGVQVHEGGGEDLIQLARKRKEPWEIEAIRSVGARTEQVVDAVREVLRNPPASLTLGDLKDLVSREITRLGMYEDHETILSQGRDAGIPHSRGDARARVRPSLPIVLDIFPADRITGYFFDMTRTFCIGGIPSRLQAIHAHVREAFELARDAMRPGVEAKSYQAMVCDYFEEHGYPTLRSDATATSGYVHGLGHGVGLDIHEKPSFALTPSNSDAIETGDIVTIEPGLYFPEQEIGVRIEETFVVTESGVESLCRSSIALEP